MILLLQRAHVDELITHAREESPAECCGLVGGTADGTARTIYRARNIALNPLVTYEAAPEDLFLAQHAMRECGEQLIAIYHSHPRATDPQPSQTDVRLAYYPSAVYFIVGLGGKEPSLRAYRIKEHEGWESLEYEVTDDLAQ
ncbi:MAG: M67 family metallopeptidase [Pyrinomonadaceae bacterium]